MKQVSNKILFVGLLIAGFLKASMASAQVCPVCVVAIGAGLGLSRWFGIDDVISSIWIGAFMVVIILGTLMWLKKKKWNFPDDGVVITLAYILLTYIPLYYAGIIGHPLNKIWGLDKIIFGSSVGAVAFFAGHWINLYLKNNNNGKALFPYQKVIMPVAALLVTSVAFYILLTWKII
jgi:hypothetical protein